MIVSDPSAFLDHLVQQTNMRVLTSEASKIGESEFLAANIYAKSIFDEDILANVSVERDADGRLVGFVRIRSKTQGVALGVGERVTLKMRQ